jgi:hypothetical protein
MRKLNLFLIIGLISTTLFSTSCDGSSTPLVTDKMSGALAAQVTLRQAQIENPTPEGLQAMHDLGMNTANLSIQKVFIYLKEMLTPAQTRELEDMRITVYPDSWIPPLSNHPTGFLVADVPVGKFPELSQKDYVIRLDTAERQLQPQNGAGPQ